MPAEAPAPANPAVPPPTPAACSRVGRWPPTGDTYATAKPRMRRVGPPTPNTPDDTVNEPSLPDLQRVAEEARKVMHTVDHGFREDIDFRALRAALEAVFGSNFTGIDDD